MGVLTKARRKAADKLNKNKEGEDPKKGHGKQKLRAKAQFAELAKLAQDVHAKHTQKMIQANLEPEPEKKKRIRKKRKKPGDAANWQDLTNKDKRLARQKITGKEQFGQEFDDDSSSSWRGRALMDMYKDNYDGERAEPQTDAEVLELRKSLGVKVQKGIELCPPPVRIADDPVLPTIFSTFMIASRLAKPSPVQAQFWPAACTGRDLIGIAQTGSGKTLAYLLPAVAHIMANDPASLVAGDGPMVLVLVPTRELTQQVAKACNTFTKLFGIRSLALYGGVDKEEQENELSDGSFAIVAATPGRVCEFVDSNKISLHRVNMLILDECDKLLKLGFMRQLSKIIELLRPDRQTLLVSATFPGPVQRAADKWLTEPVIKIRANQLAALADVAKSDGKPDGKPDGKSDGGEAGGSVTKEITQQIEMCSANEKASKLMQFLAGIYTKKAVKSKRNKAQVLVFASTVKSTKKLAMFLQQDQVQKALGGVRVGVLHGKLPQAEREAVMSDFRMNKINLLVATDLAGRGLHISKLDYVVNFEFPPSIEQYVHRVGRTGRQGRKGHAMTLFTPQNAQMAPGLIKLLREANQELPLDLVDMAISHLQHNEAHQSKKAKPVEMDDDEDADEV